MKKMYIGVDLHKGQFTVCWLTEGSKEGRINIYYSKNGYKLFEDEIRRLREEGYEEIKVGVESTGNTRYFMNRMEQLGLNCIVINTLKFKIVNQSVKKTDKHDAKTIAEFLLKDMLPESKICSMQSEMLRRLMKTRSTLVRASVKIKNQLHGLLMGIGIEISRGQMQSKKKRQQILNVLEEQGLLAKAVEPLFDTIDQLVEQVKKVEKRIEEITVDDKAIKQLMSIPGSGLITAVTIRAWADDIKRFSDAKKFCAYAGLVPWVQKSNEHAYYGHITKRGPEELRTALVQLVLGMVRYKKITGRYRLMGLYNSMKQNKGSGKTITAIARKLAVIIWSMLSNGDNFDPMKMIDKKLCVKAQEMRDRINDVA